MASLFTKNQYQYVQQAEYTFGKDILHEVRDQCKAQYFTCGGGNSR